MDLLYIKVEVVHENECTAVIASQVEISCVEVHNSFVLCRVARHSRARQDRPEHEERVEELVVGDEAVCVDVHEHEGDGPLVENDCGAVEFRDELVAEGLICEKVVNE